MRAKPFYFILAGLFLAALNAQCLAQTPAPAGIPLVIQNGTLIDGTGAAPVPDGVLVIQGDRILAAGSREKVLIPQGATLRPSWMPVWMISPTPPTPGSPTIFRNAWSKTMSP